MAYTRRKTGQYTGHRTPGDGTGFDHFPPHEACDVLGEVETTSGPNEEHTGGQPYPAQIGRMARGKE